MGRNPGGSTSGRTRACHRPGIACQVRELQRSPDLAEEITANEPSLLEGMSGLSGAQEVVGKLVDSKEVQSGQEALLASGKGESLDSSPETYIEIEAIDNQYKVSICQVKASVIRNASTTPTCWGFSVEDLKGAQEADDDMKIILAWLKQSTIPSERDLFLASAPAKAYWLNKERFLLIDGVVYRQRDSEDEKNLVLPASLREEAIRLDHDIPSAGHQGVARTKTRLKEKYYWYGMGGHINRYVSTCAECNRSKKPNRYGRVPMQEYQASAPMERVHIDFLGPLPKTQRGNEHILMIVDQFTKWVECIPLPSQSAEVTAKAAVDGFFSRFGCPFQIFSDQGRNFESKLFTSICEVLEIHKTRTTPYRPSANGQVERFNRTLMNAVRCYVRDSPEQWDVHLPQIAGALRAAVNRSTGFTPNKLMLGREVNTPAYLMFPHKSVTPVEVGEYVASLMKNIQSAHEVARDQLKTSLKRMKRDYDLRAHQREFKVGDVVYLLDTAVIKGKGKTLTPCWKGPAILIRKISTSPYSVKLQKSMLVVNHDRLKLCQDRNKPQWIQRWLENPVDGSSDGSGAAADTLYCLCRQPEQGRFMIQCDGCDEWFHGSCVNVTASEALTLDKYWCNSCTD